MPTNGGPNCAFPYNLGFRKTKTKENSFTRKWFELQRTNCPDSYTKSDISNLETKIEMQTDNRMRLRVKLKKLKYTGNVSNVVVCVIGTFSSLLKNCHNKM